MHIHIVDQSYRSLYPLIEMLRAEGHQVQVFASGNAYLSVASDLPLGCVLLDLGLPDMHGLELLRKLNEALNDYAVIVLSATGGIPEAVSAIRAGAIDFLTKPCGNEMLLAAIQRASEDITVIEERLSRHKRHAAIQGLSPREREVLMALAKGCPNKTVAYDLGISVRTVESHRAQILKKLDVRNIAAAVIMTLESTDASKAPRPARNPNKSPSLERFSCFTNTLTFE